MVLSSVKGLAMIHIVISRVNKMLYEDKQCIFLERAMRRCIDIISGTAIIISLICAPPLLYIVHHCSRCLLPRLRLLQCLALKMKVLANVGNNRLPNSSE